MSDTEKVLSWVLKGGLLLTPFLVFLVTRSLYFPFITGKNFAFRILVEILAVIWVWAALRFPIFRPRFSPLLAAVTVFIAVMGLATIFSLSPYRSFWSNFERMEGYLGLLHLLLYFLLLGSVFRTEKDWKIFFHISLAASVLISFYGVLQLAGKLAIHQGGTRVDATFGNATYLAAYLLFHLFFLVWFFLRSSHIPLRIVYAAAFLLEVVILYYTATRGAILGFLGGLTLFALLLVWFERGSLRRAALVSLGILALIPVLFFLGKDTNFVEESKVLSRFSSISPEETTTQARFTIWKMALQGWRERPILGWGQDSFIYVFSKYYEPSLWRQEPWFDRAHNVFLDWLTAGGILGLASYLGMFAAAGWLLVSRLRAKLFDPISFSIFVSLLAAYFFQNLVVFDNLASYLLFFGVLGYIHAVSLGTASRVPSVVQSVKKERAKGRSFPKAVELSGAAAALVSFLLIFYWADVKPIRAAKALLDGLHIRATHEPAGKVDATIAAFKQGIRLKSFGTMELREQSSFTATSLLSDETLAGQDKAKFLNFAIQEMETQRRTSPTDMRARAFLATLYTAAGRTSDALALIEDALNVSPRRQQFYFIAAEAYFNSGDKEHSVQILEKALALAPDYPEAIVNLASVLILIGREEEAEDLLEERVGQRFTPQERFAGVYGQVGHFDKAARVYELLVERDPNDARLRASLGVTYAQAGRALDGIREVQRAIELEPAFRAQGEQIIRRIRAGQSPIPSG